MMIALIRHAPTPGNLKKRYIGVIDESIIGGIKLDKKYPCADIVISSPLRRCLETAELIYPDHEIIIYDGLSETNFGEFENRSYEDLKNETSYIKWLENGGRTPFPGGEGMEEFTERCVRAYNEAVERFYGKRISFVVHGGTIMAIMQSLFGGNFYDYHIENLSGYIIGSADGKYSVI